MIKIEGTLVGGPAWGTALFRESDKRYTLGFHYEPECLTPYMAFEILPDDVCAVQKELEDLKEDRMASTPTIDRYRSRL